MMVWVPKGSLQLLQGATANAVTAIILKEPPKFPERWVSVEIPEGAYGQEEAPKG